MPKTSAPRQRTAPTAPSPVEPAFPAAAAAVRIEPHGDGHPVLLELMLTTSSGIEVPVRVRLTGRLAKALGTQLMRDGALVSQVGR